jgi:two-component system, OmpR family, sensor kinase
MSRIEDARRGPRGRAREKHPDPGVRSSRRATHAVTLIEHPRDTQAVTSRDGAASATGRPQPAAVSEEEARTMPSYRAWFGAARSARSRILIAYVILLAIASALALLAFRQVLVVRVTDRVDEALQQEILELDRLVTDGRDPATGEPFESLRDLFNVYLRRNVPGNEEAMLAFVDGKPYRDSRARFPLDLMPAEQLADWRALSRREGGEGRSVTGSYDTKLGEARFHVAQVRLDEEVGAFVVTALPANELEENRELLLYGGAATLLVLLIASVIAWLIAGRVLAPVQLLTETAHSISRSDLTRRIEVRGRNEAADMAHSFNSMLDRLEGVFRSQREFVQDASHELRDPLTICRGHLELLGDDPDEHREAISIVLDELDRMGRIVDDLQVLAEADQPDFLQPDWIDSGIFTDELASKASALATRDWMFDGTAQGAFFADRHRLTESVMNLAHNAVQHTQKDDVIAIGTSLNGDEARLWVRDTGSGIPVSDQERIFERFTRGRTAPSRYRGGGLGLAIVKTIAEGHGGRVELESRLGEGSTFTIVVPRHPTEGRA